jgi:BMFP domain-containing protein YqiC
MQSENRIFDDFVKMMNGAAGTIAGMAREGEASVKERAKEWIGGLDFVSRDEFEAVKAMAAAARDEVEALKARLAALEGGSAAKPKAGKAKPGVEFPE